MPPFVLIRAARQDETMPDVTAMQRLEVVARLFATAVSGEKTSTNRWREMTIVAGLLRYVSADDPQSRWRRRVLMFIGGGGYQYLSVGFCVG